MATVAHGLSRAIAGLKACATPTRCLPEASSAAPAHLAT